MGQLSLVWLGLTARLFLSLAWMFPLLIAAEILLPKAGCRTSWAARLKACAFWAVWVSTGTLVIFSLAWRGHAPHPLWTSLAPAFLPAPLAAVLGAIGAVFIADLVYYWCHRAQHRFFWRWHAVHHCVEEMSGVTAYHHVSETAFKCVLFTIPLSLVVSDASILPLIGALGTLQGHYLHSYTRLHFGPARRLLVDNRFHRIHHSRDPRHFDKNFGVVTSLWDWLFGTAYFPTRDEWPETGVAGLSEPQSIREFLLLPLSRGLGGRAPTSAVVRPAIGG